MLHFTPASPPRITLPLSGGTGVIGAAAKAHVSPTNLTDPKSNPSNFRGGNSDETRAFVDGTEEDDEALEPEDEESVADHRDDDDSAKILRRPRAAHRHHAPHASQYPSSPLWTRSKSFLLLFFALGGAFVFFILYNVLSADVPSEDESLPSYIEDPEEEETDLNFTAPPQRTAAPTATRPRKKAMTKIAVVADAGLNEASNRVLRLIETEGADLVLHTGDLDYIGDSERFYRSVDAVFGPKFPYIVTMGNYEAKRGVGRDSAWTSYYAAQRERLARVPGMKCSVVSERNLACAYGGVSFVTSAIGVNGSRLGLDLKELRNAQTKLWGISEAKNVPASWRFCCWHLPMTDFQVGFREGMPWMSSQQLSDAYDACRLRGAAVITGHEHYYVRSHTITTYGPKITDIKYRIVSADVAPEAFGPSAMSDVEGGRPNKTLRVDVVSVGPGANYAVVSGLGGHSVSVPSAKRAAESTHLASVHPKMFTELIDPGGKYFFPEITGAMEDSTTSSNKLRATLSPAGSPDDYPFGALFAASPPRARPRLAGRATSKRSAGRSWIDLLYKEKAETM